MVPHDAAVEQPDDARRPAEASPSAAGGFPRIDGYRIEGVLGRGSTGVVYSAIQLAVERPVALKILHPELVGTKRAVRRLQREARTAAKLAHPSIISAIDMGEQDGQWWYAMELVEGISLAERISERGPMSEREALRFFIPLCDALSHVFEGGVVHRDVKPANILIDAHGRARLVDLGLAFAEDDPMLTSTGGTLGTPHYISPEQARDPATADTKSDIWSLGATMYHALCGRPPFQGESVAEILSGVLYGRVPDPRLFAPHLSRGLSLVLRKCLTRDPARRYQSPDQLMRDLERVRERRSPEVRAAGLDPVDTGRPEWVRRAVAGGVGAALLAGGALLVARPWAPAAGPGAGSGPRRDEPVASWPQLEAIERGFDDGGRSHAAALQDLAHLGAVPVGWEARAGRLEVRILESLESELVTLQLDASRELDALLGERAYERSAEYLERGLPGTLAERTGFERFAALPDGRLRSRFQAWWERAVARVGDEREKAVQRAERTLRAHLEDVVIPAAKDLYGEERRWGDAVEVLNTSGTWLDDAGAGVQGLSAADRAGVVERARAEVRLDTILTRVRNDFLRVDGELSDHLREQSRRIRDRLARGEAPGAAGELRDAYDAELERRGIDLAQVPRAWRTELGSPTGSLALLERLAESLAAEEQELFRKNAGILYERDVDEADELSRARRYSDAIELWERRLGDSWPEDLHARVERRRREALLLQSVVERAAAGVVARRNETFSPVFQQIRYPDARIGTAEDALNRGFEVRPQGFPPFRAYLVAPPEGIGTGKLLEAPDVLALAGLGGAELTPRERFQRALFLFHEGAAEEASAGLPAAGFEGDDLLPDLRERILAARQTVERRQDERTRQKDALVQSVRRSHLLGGTADRILPEITLLLGRYTEELTHQERAELEGIREDLRPDADRATLQNVYGPNRPLKLVGQLGVELVWDFSTGAAGAWQIGDWTSVGPLQLLEPRESDEEFWSAQRNLRLPLVLPLDASKRLALSLELRSLSDHRLRNELVVSVAGIHLVFEDEPGDPAFVAGHGEARELMERARAGVTSGFGGFRGFPRGEPFVIEAEVNPRTGDVKVWVAGEELRVKQIPQSKEEPVPAEILVHVRQPMELFEARLEGQRVPGSR